MESRFEAYTETAKMGMTFWVNTPSQTMSKLQTMITDTDITADYMLVNQASSVELFRSITFVIDIFTYVFVFMISSIVVANVFNTISTNIKLRGKELAMLHSLGMSNHSFNRMMNFECFFFGIRTLLYGSQFQVSFRGSFTKQRP